MMKNVILFLLLIITIIIYYFNHNNQENFKNKKKDYLVILAIFKNEEDYIYEWLDFHIKQGIDHFYLYDNNDIINKNFFKKYNDKVTIIPWNNISYTKVNTVQRQAYNHFIQNFNNNFKWVLQCDIDEFIYSIDPKIKNIKEIINKYTNNNTSHIRIPRYNFGDSNHKTKQKGGILKNFIYREKYISSYKAISNINFIDTNIKSKGVHRFIYKKNGNIINKHIKIRIKRNNKITKNEIPLVINHYYTKSREEYVNRCNMWKDNKINFIDSRKNCNNIDIYNKINKNEVKDKNILELII